MRYEQLAAYVVSNVQIPRRNYPICVENHVKNRILMEIQLYHV